MDESHISKDGMIKQVLLGDIRLDKNRMDYLREHQSLVGIRHFGIDKRIFNHIDINGLSIIYEKEDIGSIECYLIRNAEKSHHHIEHRILGIASSIGIGKDKRLYAYSVKHVIEDYIKELIATELIEKNQGLCPYAISFKTGF